MRRVAATASFFLVLASLTAATLSVPHGPDYYSVPFASRFSSHPAHNAAADAHRRLNAGMVAAGTPLIDLWTNDTIEANGWIALKIVKTPNASNTHHAPGAVWYAAGFAEGAALQVRINQAWRNTVKTTPNATLLPALKQWIEKHVAYMQSNVARFNQTDPYWKHVGLLLMQIQGLTDGYNSVAPADELLTFFDMFVYNFQYEMEDVQAAVVSDMPLAEIKKRQAAGELYQFARGGCTVMIRPTSDDLFVVHTTWASYTSMIRVVRDIDLGDVRMSFTGYPGMLASQDDWYMLSTNLTVTETTNLMFNNAAYEFTIPQSVSEFIRVMVANSLAVDGNSWVNTFARYNDGAYNNQYMIVDHNLYVPGTPASELPDNLLWVIEQMPGMTPNADMTPVLRKQGYWASYNRQYFQAIRNVSGITWAVQHYNNSYFTHDGSPRAVITERFVANNQLNSLSDLQHFIRFNEWETDPASICPGCENPRHNALCTISG
jgi:hypothetical protein